ncbi:MAG: pyridoxal phosphate-dependent decarboxylase family protein [Promethearchaeota archaeon]|jgi:glutamate/tyrosine decarboxylase-like PLP-dependent enzyme
MNSEETLDPESWEDLKILGHKMLDDMLDHLRDIREQPVWQPIPKNVKLQFNVPLPTRGQKREKIYDEFKKNILPYPLGNIHPRFWGWVVGSGSPFGVLAEMLAATMNPNVVGGEHIANYVEAQVIEWTKEMLGYDPSASGILVSGASMANFIGLTVARNNKAGYNIIEEGVRASEKELLIYGSTEMHSSIDKTIQLLGLGTKSLRKVPINENFEIQVEKLRELIEADLRSGHKPICIIGSAGTVNTGAVDDLKGLAELAREYNIWFHIDAAFGVWCKLSIDSNKLLEGIELADSIAFDYHKWMYINFEAGCALVKNRKEHYNAFNFSADYATHQERGTSSGDIWYDNYGIQLSRGFRALKIWMCIKENGSEKYGRLIEQNIQQAQYLTKIIKKEPKLELLAPTNMNIVNFRYIDKNIDLPTLNKLNKEILFQLQEKGIAVPSNRMLNENFAIRVAITNHRTKKEDLEVFLNSVLEIAENLIKNNVI